MHGVDQLLLYGLNTERIAILKKSSKESFKYYKRITRL